MTRSRSWQAALVQTAAIFAALGDETRLRLLARLGESGPLSLGQLAVQEPVTRQAVTKHLQALESAGLVRSNRAGRERIWELQPDTLSDVQHHLEQISAHWDRAIGRLKRMVEDG